MAWELALWKARSSRMALTLLVQASEAASRGARREAMTDLTRSGRSGKAGKDEILRLSGLALNLPALDVGAILGERRWSERRDTRADR